MYTFGERLKKLRKEKGISLDELAISLKTTKATLSRYENSLREPKIEFAKKIADFFNVDIDYLLGSTLQPIEHLKQAQINLQIATQKALEPVEIQKKLLNDTVQELIGNKFKEIQNMINDSLHQSILGLTPTGELVKIPVLGRIPAGTPIEVVENIIDYIEVPKSEVSNGEYFYLQVIGDSMIGSRIYEGDRVLVRKQADVESGEISVVRTNGYDATLKRVKKVDGQVILYPDNPNYEPIIIDSKDAIIIGKVVKVEFDPNKKY